MKTITPCLWFDLNALQAAEFYVSIFKNSKITQITHYPDSVAKVANRPKGSVMTVMFELNGQEYMGLNGGPGHQSNQSISLMACCDTQDEVDYYWKALSAGGQEIQCGWLKDKFGFHWQIVPKQIFEMMHTKDTAKLDRYMQAMMTMVKLDLPTLQKAYNG
ncbi:MAG TPA: VOC family protein [Phycisphaerales bacterium]|nr:VOC family protein [Phycisphaerales bacterium]